MPENLIVFFKSQPTQFRIPKPSWKHSRSSKFETNVWGFYEICDPTFKQTDGQTDGQKEISNLHLRIIKYFSPAVISQLCMLYLRLSDAKVYVYSVYSMYTVQYINNAGRELNAWILQVLINQSINLYTSFAISHDPETERLQGSFPSPPPLQPSTQSSIFNFIPKLMVVKGPLPPCLLSLKIIL